MFAYEHGYINLGEVRGFPGHFMFRKQDHEGGLEARHLTVSLMQDGRVVWAEQQFGKLRVKREANIDNQSLLRVKRDSRRTQHFLERELFKRLVLDKKVKSIPEDLIQLWQEEAALDQPAEPAARDEMFNDELWDHQWYLHDTRYLTDNLPDISLHVEPVWRKGVTGSGVRVVVIDDGIDHTHPDLSHNYAEDLSHDFNGGDDDPSPADLTNSHGTRCAGEIAMMANNHLCGVGVAYNATIGGIRMLDGKISDTIEALALSFALDKVDIFSSSWGPNDDGATVEGPGKLASEALRKGVTEGRGGRGVIYVWASGNGGGHGDDCNCDGYAASVFTLSVSSASQQGQATWYGESCTSTLTSTYSSGAYTDQKIATTDVGGGCTVSHTGTSAAAPLAAGILALVLQTNPGLTWRDVQHLVVFSSNPQPLMANSGWKQNGAGLWYNPRFGFGILDANTIVEMASVWNNVPASSQCHLTGETTQDLDTRQTENDNENDIGEKDVVAIKFSSEECDIDSVEQVEAIINVQHPVRGEVEALLVSPSGTRSHILSPRPSDLSDKGFHSWSLMTVESWGEPASGSWHLYLVNRGGRGVEWEVGHCQLVIHGIKKREAGGS